LAGVELWKLHRSCPVNNDGPSGGLRKTFRGQL
jgi:hypothetical protein